MIDKNRIFFDYRQLMAGSGVTPEKDEELNAPIDDFNDDSSNSTESSLPNLDKDDIPENHYNAEIPGPLTRLFVITNRALSKLMQDLILVRRIVLRQCLYRQCNRNLRILF